MFPSALRLLPVVHGAVINLLHTSLGNTNPLRLSFLPEGLLAFHSHEIYRPGRPFTARKSLAQGLRDIDLVVRVTQRWQWDHPSTRCSSRSSRRVVPMCAIAPLQVGRTRGRRHRNNRSQLATTDPRGMSADSPAQQQETAPRHYKTTTGNRL